MMAEKAKKFMTGAAKTVAVDILRGYVAKRVRAIEVDDIINAIESNDTDLIGKLSEDDKKRLILVASRFKQYIDLLTVKNIMIWLIEDAPLHAGVIYGHPQGIEWLRKVVEQLRTYVESQTTESQEPSFELIPVEEAGASKGEG
jgi:hypothetical protein